MLTENYDELFQGFLTVCNRVLDQYGDQPPFEKVLRHVERLPDGGRIAAAVHEDMDEPPVGTFTIGFSGGKVRMVSHVAEEPEYDGESVLLWRVSADHLRDVVADPQTYVDNPEKLDWDWLLAELMQEA